MLLREEEEECWYQALLWLPALPSPAPCRGSVPPPEMQPSEKDGLEGGFGGSGVAAPERVPAGILVSSAD